MSSNITVIRPAQLVKKSAGGFNTVGAEVIRASEPVTILVLKYIKASSTIQAQCADGHLRECRTLKLDADPTVAKDKARQLWKALREATLAEQPVTFYSSGVNFWPNRWFSKVTV
jgi:hypothetical protein